MTDDNGGTGPASQEMINPLGLGPFDRFVKGDNKWLPDEQIPCKKCGRFTQVFKGDGLCINCYHNESDVW